MWPRHHLLPDTAADARMRYRFIPLRNGPLCGNRPLIALTDLEELLYCDRQIAYAPAGCVMDSIRYRGCDRYGRKLAEAFNAQRACFFIETADK